MSTRMTDDTGHPTKRVWLLPAIVIGGGILIIAIVGVLMVLLTYDPQPEPQPSQSQMEPAPEQAD